MRKNQIARSILLIYCSKPSEKVLFYQVLVFIIFLTCNNYTGPFARIVCFNTNAHDDIKNY